MAEDQILEAFRELDPGNTGTLSRDKLRSLLQILDPEAFSDTVVDQLLDGADLNNSGDLRYVEFLEWVRGGPEEQEQAAPADAKPVVLSIRLQLNERMRSLGDQVAHRVSQFWRAHGFSCQSSPSVRKRCLHFTTAWSLAGEDGDGIGMILDREDVGAYLDFLPIDAAAAERKAADPTLADAVRQLINTGVLRRDDEERLWSSFREQVARAAQLGGFVLQTSEELHGSVASANKQREAAIIAEAGCRVMEYTVGAGEESPGFDVQVFDSLMALASGEDVFAPRLDRLVRGASAQERSLAAKELIMLLGNSSFSGAAPPATRVARADGALVAVSGLLLDPGAGAWDKGFAAGLLASLTGGKDAELLAFIAAQDGVLPGLSVAMREGNAYGRHAAAVALYNLCLPPQSARGG